MATQMYCYVSEGDVFFVPVDSYQDTASTINNHIISNNHNHIHSTTTSHKYGTTEANNISSNNNNNNINANSNGYHLKLPSIFKVKNKNLLYSLNDPSLSDLDSTNDTSVNEDEDDEDDNGSFNDSRTDENIHESSKNEFPFTGGTKKALYLPQFTVDLATNLDNGFAQVKDLLIQVFPWIQEPNDICIKQITGGITNMLLSCKHLPTGLTVLMRVYGQGTNLIIDRHREFVLHLVLNSLNLAPPIHARFHNGLVYGFLPGRSLQPEELKNPQLFPLIAQQLGVWHKKVSLEDIEVGVEKLRRFTKNLKKQDATNANTRSGSRSPSRRRSLLLQNQLKSGGPSSVKRSISNVWELIEDWMNIVPIIPELVESFKENNSPEIATTYNEENMREVIQNEFEWLRNELTENSKSPVVSCHCDLLSGNIIVPENFFDTILSSTSQPQEQVQNLPPVDSSPIQFIDYEYMLPAPRAFDIANHLAEWQGFDCDRASIPTPSNTNPVMVNWVKGYLNNNNATDDQVNKLIDEIAMFYGMPGFYWGVWAMIQSEISTIDFDYANYGKLRFREYWDWKQHYLKKKHK